METLEKGKNKLGQICDILRKETLEPAQGEAQKIIEDAKGEAQKIIEKANLDAKSIIDDAHQKVEQEKKLFETSMDLGVKQTFHQLKELIQNKIFNDELLNLSNKVISEKDLLSKIVAAVVSAVDKEGLDARFSVYINEAISTEEFSKYLAEKALSRVKSGEIAIETSSSSGARVVLKDQKMSVDISEQSLKELMGSFLKESFKDVLFKNV